MKEVSILKISAIQSLIGKIIRDIRTGGKRETRNALALCKTFSNRGFVKTLTAMMQEYLSCPQSKYPALIHRVSVSVRENTLKTLFVNFVSHDYSDGKLPFLKLIGNNPDSDFVIPISADGDPDAQVSEANGKNHFIFFVNAADFESSPERICSVIQKNIRNIFVLRVDGSAAGRDFVLASAHFENAVFVSDYASSSSIFPLLSEQQTFFGLLRSRDEFLGEEQEKTILNQAISGGAIFSVYYSDAHSKEKLLNRVKIEENFTKLNECRKKGKLELVLFDLDRDIGALRKMMISKKSSKAMKALQNIEE